MNNNLTGMFVVRIDSELQWNYLKTCLNLRRIPEFNSVLTSVPNKAVAIRIYLTEGIVTDSGWSAFDEYTSLQYTKLSFNEMLFKLVNIESIPKVKIL